MPAFGQRGENHQAVIDAPGDQEPRYLAQRPGHHEGESGVEGGKGDDALHSAKIKRVESTCPEGVIVGQKDNSRRRLNDGETAERWSVVGERIECREQCREEDRQQKRDPLDVDKLAHRVGAFGQSQKEDDQRQLGEDCEVDQGCQAAKGSVIVDEVHEAKPVEAQCLIKGG